MNVLHLNQRIKLKFHNIKFKMLTDSKVRQAGFIRNSSSRKIIYHPEPSGKNSQSDDSFSSFQYQNHSKVSIRSVQKKKNNNTQSRQQKQQCNMKQQKPSTPQIPKPSKKPSQPLQPQFQNQRLKNNFFQQKPYSNQENLQKLKQLLPRSNTPQFNQSNLKRQLQEVNSICNRIGTMKLEGNFSFNPKINNRIMKQNQMEGKLELDSDEEENSRKNIKNLPIGHKGNIHVSKQISKKPKQNNYFSTATNQGANKFQYDFQSSSDQHEEVQSSQFQGNHQEQYVDEYENQALDYYQEQQRKKTQPQLLTRTQPKVTTGKISNRQSHQLEQNYSQIQKQHHNIPQPYQITKNNPSFKQSSSKVQNQESFSSQNDQQLITEYKKNDFGHNIPQQMRNHKQQLTQNRAYQNMKEPEPQQGLIATNGGVCFSVDVKQFSNNSSVANCAPVRRQSQQQKKKKVNEKDEILKRRQMAKIYSKQSRFRLFGFS